MGAELAELTTAVEQYIAQTDPSGPGALVIGAVIVVEILRAESAGDESFIGLVTPSVNESTSSRLGLLTAGLAIARSELTNGDGADDGY